MNAGLLIADADPELCDIYRIYFNDCGFDVETAGNGAECLAKLMARLPEVLIVDLEAAWGGDESVTALLGKRSSLPAVFVTGDDPPERLSERSGIPAGRCFQKPYRLDSLLDGVLSAAPHLSSV